MGNTNIFKSLFVNFKINSYGDTLLTKACIDNDLDKVKELLFTYKANTDTRDNWGYTALMLASTESSTEFVRLLLEAGANPNEQNEWGWSSLIRASDKNRIENTKALLKGGAKTNLKNSLGWTALFISIKYKYKKIIKILKRIVIAQLLNNY